VGGTSFTWEQAVEAAKRALHERRGDITPREVMDELTNMLGPDLVTTGPENQVLLWDVIHYLVYRGLARPQTAEAVRITVQGERTLGSVAWLEADDYVRTIEGELPEGVALDPVVVQYLREAHSAFRAGLLLSCAVTLGAAAEKIVLLVRDGAMKHLPEAAKELDSWRLGVVFGALQTALFKSGKLREIAQGKGLQKPERIESFECLFRLYQFTRNDTGHPTGYEPRRDEMLAFLEGFRTFAKVGFELIELLK